MAELVPYPFAALVRRMFRELAEHDAVFDLPARRFYGGSPRHDFSVEFHGRRVGSPLGPAAGPHSQMAQNLVLAWLGGCRVFELKTVQIRDRLEIPRPCIDVRTVGFNVEWSQELTLEQSLEEYVKGAMLIEMLRAGGAGERLPLTPGFGGTDSASRGEAFDGGGSASRGGEFDGGGSASRGWAFDMSVGYDLEGIRQPRVQAFISGLADAGPVIERLRRQIPAEYAALRDLDFPARLCDTVTLSTFHGCPPGEIAAIIEHLMEEHRLHAVVKFNPMLLGREETLRLLHERLGYTHLTVPETAFSRDTTWDQAVEIMQRLGARADRLGLGLGAKFTNTLIVLNDQGFLAPGEKEAYLSGPPLHLLAMHLVGRFRAAFGDRFPVSFSAGIDRHNYADAAALGLKPITVCTDLLKPGGYGRLAAYHQELAQRMDAIGARDLDEFALLAYGQGEAALMDLGLPADDPRRESLHRALQALRVPRPVEADAGAPGASPPDRGPGASTADDLRAAGGALVSAWVSAARQRNTVAYLEQADADSRYSWARNSRPPRRIGRHLQLFDCISCDKCVPVCPNDANFTFRPERREVPVTKLRRHGSGWRLEAGDTTPLVEDHQLGTFADFCNECGNCDVFCPEEGGPYLVKPLFFGSEAGWRASGRSGFFVERREEGDRVLGRAAGREFELRRAGSRVEFRGAGFALAWRDDDPGGTIEGTGPDEVDLTWCHILEVIRQGILASGNINYLNMNQGGAPAPPE